MPPDPLVLTDIFLRGGAVTLLAVANLLFLLRAEARRKAWMLTGLCVGLSAYLLVSTPNLGLDSGWAARLLIMTAGTEPVFVYWVGLGLFLDRVRPRWWQIALSAAVILSAWAAPLSVLIGLAHSGTMVLIYVALLYVALTTAANDLVESRRHFRRWFLAVMAGLGTVIAVAEVLQLDRDMPAAIYPLHAAIFVVLAGVFLLWCLRIMPDLWPAAPPPDRAPPTGPAPTGPAPPGPGASAAATPAEGAVLRRIDEAMQGGIWRREGLSIKDLADAVDAPEHRVRRAINHGLGYRNFARFINDHRIAAAREMLGDPVHADMAVLSIAYEVGFGSIGPFNRAFRDITGQSPTEFRRDRVQAA